MSTRASQYAARVERRDELSPHLVRLTLAVDPALRVDRDPRRVGRAGGAGAVPEPLLHGPLVRRRQLVLDVVLHEVGLVTEWVVRDDCVGSTVTITEPKGSFDAAAGRGLADAGR